jgi:PII-like signaling protein
VSADSLKLTVYFGESDRVGHKLLSDALVDACEEHGIHVAVLLRAVEGFGLEQTLHTERFLSLSEDLPLVAIAVDERARVEGLLPEVSDLVAGGLVTLERARLLHDGAAVAAASVGSGEATKLTVYLGRDERVRGRPAFVEVVELLHRTGLAGGVALLGVDGTAHRERRRARFFSRNGAVPMMVVAVGTGEQVAGTLPLLDELLRDPIVTLERVRLCKRDGRQLSLPEQLPTRDEAGLGLWQKLTVHAGEQARHRGRPLHTELIRRLRAEGASGATSLRGVYGFSGDHAPHGDRLFEVRRRVPVLTTIVDRPDRIRRWFGLVDEVTDEAGLVTSELVPAYHAVASRGRVGGIRLARPPG